MVVCGVAGEPHVYPTPAEAYWILVAGLLVSGTCTITPVGGFPPAFIAPLKTNSPLVLSIPTIFLTWRN